MNQENNNNNSNNKNINSINIKNPENTEIEIKIDPQDLVIEDDDSVDFLNEALDTTPDSKENPELDNSSDFNDISDENTKGNDLNNNLQDSNSKNDNSDGEKLDINDDDEKTSDSENKKDGEEASDSENKKDGEESSDSENKKDDGESSDSENKKDGEDASDSENKKDGEESSDSENKKDDDKDKNGDDKKPDDKDKNGDDKKPDDKDKKGDDKKPDDKDKNGNDKKPDDKNKNDGDKKPNDKDKNGDNKSAADKKRDEAKQKQQNNRNSGSKPSLKDRARNGIKNAPKNAANRAKQKAKDSLTDSSIGQAAEGVKNAVNTAKETVDKTKKAVSFIIKHWHLCLGIAVGTVVFLLALLLITSFISPGKNGSVEDEEFETNYVEKDQKVLEKLKNDSFNTSGDADTKSLAMAAVTYPFFSELQSSSVKAYLEGQDSCNDSSDEDCESNSGEEDLDKDETDEDVSEDEESIDYDIYLRPYYKKHIRKDLRETIEGLNGKSEEEQNTYLKEVVFGRGGMYVLESKKFITAYNGYKNLFKKLKDGESKEELENQIIEDLRSISSQFLPYIFENMTCATNLVDAGTLDAGELIKNAVAGNIYVDLKKPGCSSMSQCSESYYSAPLPFKDYIMGVMYAELGASNNVDQLAAQAVAAQSFTLSRRTNSIKKTEEGAYVIPMLWSTADQDFCHVDLGCNSSDIKEKYGYNKPNVSNKKLLMHGNNHDAAPAEKKKQLEEAWEKAKDVYIVDSNGNAAQAGYYEGSGCKPGSCMDQKQLENQTLDYKNILGYFYSNYAVSTISSDGIASVQVAGTQECTNGSTDLTAKRNMIKVVAIDSINGGIPYYDGGLPNSKVYSENNFNTDVPPDSGGRTKRGLNEVGFVNFIYWSAIDENFGNTNDINSIISKTYDITKEQLLIGDIGISSDNSLIGIYIGEEKWAYESKVSGKSVAEPNNNFTIFKRLNEFKNESYNYTIRTNAPTVGEWSNMDNYYDTNNTCQCVWYAKNRAIEILNELYKKSSITKKQYDIYTKRISNTRGNGNQFTLNGSINMNNSFKGSNNINDFKAGSFIGMKSWYSSAGQTYGHVVVIEKVDFENKKIYTTDGSHKGNCSRNNFSGLAFNYKEYTFDEFYQRYNPTDSAKFDFYGYLYFLED